jgi:hypothetical protein
VSSILILAGPEEHSDLLWRFELALMKMIGNNRLSAGCSDIRNVRGTCGSQLRLQANNAQRLA